MWKRILLKLSLLSFFFVFPLQGLVGQSSSESNTLNTSLLPDSRLMNPNLNIDLNLPLSLQSWTMLDLTQLSLKELYQAYMTESDYSINLTKNLQSQLSYSNLQILSLQQSLESSQEESKKLQEDLNLALSSKENLEKINNEIVEENKILKEESLKKEKKLWITVGVTFAGASIGVPLVVDGIKNSNFTEGAVGAVLVLGTVAFDYLFNFKIEF